VRGVSGGETRIIAVWSGYQASALVKVTGPWKKHEGPAVCMQGTTRAPARVAKCCRSGPDSTARTGRRV
jgi:hypothetical protein